MEEEKKRCPYCGEEILAVAKKCKHCGEWLIETDTQKDQCAPKVETNAVKVVKTGDSSEDEEIFTKNIPLSNTAILWSYWVAIIGLVISTAHGLIQDGDILSTSTGSGKARLISAILNFFSTIPEWIGQVLETFGVIVLLLAIWQAMSNMRKPFGKLFEWLVYLEGIAAVLFIVSDFMDDGILLVYLATMILVSQMIIQIILGLKISTVYYDRINYMGKVMYLCGGIELLVFLIHLFCFMLVSEEETLFWINFVHVIIDAIVLYVYYLTLKTMLLHSDKE